MAVTSPSVLPGNLFTAADSDFEGTTTIWTAVSGATVSVSTSQAFVGSKSLQAAISSAANPVISSAAIPATPNTGYVFSANTFYIPSSYNVTITIQGQDVNHTNIGSPISSPVATQVSSSWLPISFAFTTNTWGANVRFVTVQISFAAIDGTTLSASTNLYVDLCYLSNPKAQVLIDWINPTYAPASQAGNAFADMTPWVRYDQTMTLSHGRQDAVSEIQPGQASFTLENNAGWFTPSLSTSPYYPNITLGRRIQINEPDQLGNWVTRFDGAISEITYTVDVTGGTNMARVSASDVLAYVNRQPSLPGWTRATVMADAPLYHWPMNDSQASGVCAEMSGNNGPPMRPVNYATSGTAAITWRSTNGGVETLANASSTAVGASDGSAYWVPGKDTPTSLIRGLASGAVGPNTTPLSSPYLVPVLTTQTVQNAFIGTDGWQFQTELFTNGVPNGLNPNIAGNNYSIEAWFIPDPTIKTKLGQNLGPFTIFSLGSSRRSDCIVVGLYYSGSNLLMEMAVYSQPPAFPMQAYSVIPTPVLSISSIITADSVARPHHLVVELTGGASPFANLYLDGSSVFGMSLLAGQVFDTITVGGAFGGHGSFYGQVSCVSIYNYMLNQTQLTNHCMVGQYGYWEQTTDNCIAALGTFANIPVFWNNLRGQNYGLSLTEYVDITGASVLSTMQSYEQAERGLLYVNSAGQLNFHTRDWRMGYGAPDVTLPQSIYNADLGYELIDTYTINQAATSTPTYSGGIAWLSTSSSQSYGPYPSGTQNSPISLPLITWSRAYSSLGLPEFVYWSDPNLNDNSAWQINTRNNPRLICGQLGIDLLSFDTIAAGSLTIANLLALDVDNMVTLGGLPSSFPDQAGATDYFIEGMTETIGLTEHLLKLYTSPATPQRAWKPGDNTYGVLGSTSRIGISMPDTSPTPALGKSVAHDGGAPFWPPTFTTVPSTFQTGSANGTTVTSLNIATSYMSVQGDTMLVQVMAAAAATITVTDIQGNTYNQVGSVTLSTGVVQYVFAATNAIALAAVANAITITSSISQSFLLTSSYNVHGLVAVDGTPVTAIGTSTTPSVTLGTVTTNDWELVIMANNGGFTYTIPTGWIQMGYNVQSTQKNQMFWKQATSTTGDTCSSTQSGSAAWGALAIAFTVASVVLNNPANNGHQFIGATEIRGLHDTMATALAPPLCVVGDVSHSTTYSSGNNGTQNRAVWDTIWIDNVGGMGLIPSWPNWYTVTVPGFYEISGAFVWAIQGSGTAGVRTAWIVVAQAAAQKVANGTGSPFSDTYVVPIGEQLAGNNVNKQPIDAFSNRIYLGVGDMVGIGCMQNQGTTLNNSNVLPTMMSIRWLGYNTVADQNPTAGTPGGGSTTISSTLTTYTRSWNATATYSYWGTSSSYTPQLRNTNGSMYQGQYSGGSAGGAQFSVATFNQADVAAKTAGATINSCFLQMTNQHSWYNSGASLQIGMSKDTSFGNSYNPFSGNSLLDAKEIWFNQFQTINMNIGTWFATQLQTGNYKSFIFGNGNTDLKYYGYWQGSSNPKLTITYTK